MVREERTSPGSAVTCCTRVAGLVRAVGHDRDPYAWGLVPPSTADVRCGFLVLKVHAAVRLPRRVPPLRFETMPWRCNLIANAQKLWPHKSQMARRQLRQSLLHCLGKSGALEVTSLLNFAGLASRSASISIICVFRVHRLTFLR